MSTFADDGYTMETNHQSSAMNRSSGNKLMVEIVLFIAMHVQEWGKISHKCIGWSSNNN